MPSVPKPTRRRQIYETGEEVQHQRVPKQIRAKNSAAKKAVRKSYCEVCGDKAWGGAHHILTVASGGPDDEWNLIQLCRVCHIHKAHGGIYSKRFLFSVVAQREGVGVDELIEAVSEVRRTGVQRCPN